jgi:aspartyl-tRNA(Asn)/glutamyl-tRNA(Gln) amidotransferase subunit B
LPAARRERYQATHALGAYDAAVLTADPDATGLFEATLASDPSLAPKSVANWVTGEYLRLRKSANSEAAAPQVAPAELAAIIRAVEDGAISRANGKEVFEAHVGSGESAAAIIAARGLHQISDSVAVGTAVDEAIAANPAAVADYRAGKVQAVGFLVGQVMKATRGQANAALVQAAVRERLERLGRAE